MSRRRSKSTPRSHKNVPSSVECVGGYDASSTADFVRRVREQGVIDLTVSKKSSSNEDMVFSVPDGKRSRKDLFVKSESKHCIILENRWSQGNFRWVHKAKYSPNPRIRFDDGGPQNGELCVLKEFKTGSVYEDHFFDKDILAVDKAAGIIKAFNNSMSEFSFRRGVKTVRLNRPSIWEDVDPDTNGKFKKKLCEPMLEGDYLKFNSNSGYFGSSDFMQALSHYSFQFAVENNLCVIYRVVHYKEDYVLTDPVVMSHDNSKKYGSGDLGAEGIDNFFAHHRCGKFCSKLWLKPKRPVKSNRIPLQSTTSLSLTLGSKKTDTDRMRTLNTILAKKRKTSQRKV
ncbi:kinase-like protein [Fragilariopsis cylindrus CCMP1102]|uniref:Kinase-like protein n=1 Tax=Fragilariopsis cylindrus CCMP1102 TaxID=635003 RepID=A0A1E7F4L2_9STRA|nr:kinase-like protein [Fragilariopsis cylindrus CCMP1102]|eukprot:OEU13122.1 kinase-like protein [Fragilariopsis cylindrus CCMP1102]